MASQESRSVRLNLVRQMASKTTLELKTDLAGLLAMTADNLLRIAVIIKTLEDRGESMESFNGSCLEIFRRIAAGSLLPDIVVLFADSPGRLRKAASMPIGDQKKILNGKKKVKVGSGKGGQKTEQNHLLEMAKSGSPKDVGMSAAEMIVNSSDPPSALRAALVVLEAHQLI